MLFLLSYSLSLGILEQGSTEALMTGEDCLLLYMYVGAPLVSVRKEIVPGYLKFFSDYFKFSGEPRRILTNILKMAF